MSSAARVVAQNTNPTIAAEPDRLVVEIGEGRYDIIDIRRHVVVEDVPISTFARHGIWFQVPEGREAPPTDGYAHVQSLLQGVSSNPSLPLGKIQGAMARWSGPVHDLSTLAELSAAFGADHPGSYRVVSFSSYLRDAKRLTSTVVDALSHGGCFDGTIWVVSEHDADRPLLDGPVRQRPVTRNETDRRRFESGSHHFAILSGGEPVSVLPKDRFEGRVSVLVVGGVRKESAALVRELTRTSAAHIWLAEPRSMHVLRLGGEDAPIDQIARCVAGVASIEQPKTRAGSTSGNLLSAAEASLTPTAIEGLRQLLAASDETAMLVDRR